MGKSDRELSDDTVVRIQTAEVEDSKKRAVVVREKKAQLQEYLEWKKEAESLVSHEIEALQELWGKLTETSLTEVGLSSLQKTVKKHGFNKVYDAIKDSCERHLRLSSKDGLTYTRPSCEKALSKISSTIMWTDKWKDNPHLEKIHYIKGILRNRFTISWADQSKLVEMMEVSRVDGTDLITMQECAVFCKSLEEFMEEML